MKKNLIGWGIVGLIVFAVVMTIPTFNKITKLDLVAESAEANVETNLQRRADLLNNAAEATKGYANNEQKTFIEVAQARAGAAKLAPIDPKTGSPATKDELAANAELRKKFTENQAAAAQATQQAVMAINQVREAYPDLKSSVLFINLTKDIKDTEDKILKVRAMSIGAVRNYNQAIRVIPGNIIAGLWGFKVKPFFEADAESKKAPKLMF